MIRDAYRILQKKNLKVAAIALLLFVGMAGALATFPHPSIAATNATNGGNALTTVTYQAENAYLTGGMKVNTSITGFSGSGYIDGGANIGAKTIFTVNSPVDGIYAVTLHYANGAGSNQTLSIVVNGLKQLQTSLPTTTGWSDSIANLALRMGLNTISYEHDSGDSGDVSLDYITIPSSIPLALRGATLPYVEYEAESAVTNGTVIGPDRTYLNIASEASGRSAVKLSGQGQYVEFTLTQPANAINIRYSIPDSADGAGLTSPLSVYINGTHHQDLTLTSKYSWVYGKYPYTNNPGDGSAHHFFDETRALLGSILPAGTKVRLQVDAANAAVFSVIDLADFYNVPAAYTQPAGYLSIANYGADPTGATDATQAVQNAVNAAESQGKGVWIPSGTFTVSSHISLNNVTVRGAGPWYSTLQGNGVGLYGSNPGTNIQLYDFAIFGQTTVRNDSSVDSGVGGSMGGGSVLQDLWLEHSKTGMWFDGPSNGLLIVGDTIRNTFADGINLHMGVSNTTVEQTQVRNTGDDGMAMWSQTNADQNDIFAFNTVQLPMLANDFGVYGGTNNSVTDNLGFDTVVVGSGVNVGNRYGAVGLAGTTTIAQNTFVRTGSFNINDQKGTGAIWFSTDSGEPAITSAINVTNDEIDSSSYAAFQFVGSANITNVAVDHVNINGAGSYALQEEVAGSAIFNNVTATGLGVAGQYNCGAKFTITQGAGNSGWSNVVCGSLTATATPSTIPAAQATATPSVTLVPITTPGSSITPTAQAASIPSTTPTAQAASTSNTTPLPTSQGKLVLAMRAGGSATGNFVADMGFSVSNQYTDTSTTIDTSGVSNPAPQAVWQSCRWNDAFSYTLSSLTPGASYTVQLDWAELTWQRAGQRKFNVAINGNQVLNGFDVYATAGYKKALARQFPAMASSSGQIVIAFTQGGVDNPFINGIELYTV